MEIPDGKADVLNDLNGFNGLFMEPRKIIRSAGTVGGFTMMSRALGLVRDVLMAGFFGTSLSMSAFVVAFTIPNLFRRLFGEGALSAAFVPVLVETREKEGGEKAWILVNRVLSLLAVVLTLITAVIVLFAFTLPLGGEKTVAVVSLLRIMMPYMIFICLAAVSMGVLNSLHHFAVPAFAPCLLNIVWIATVLLVVPHLGGGDEAKIHAIAWAVLLAGVLQWAVQWPTLVRHGWKPAFRPDISDARVKKILFLMGPAALGMAATQINVMIDKFLAMWVSPEAPSALFFSERLIYFPLGIFATALGTVLLPVFSGHAARADYDQIRLSVTNALRHLLFIMIPASVGLLVLARPIVQMIFEWKAFGAGSTAMTALALQCYAPGLIVFSLAKILVPAFYAMQDTRTPVRIGVAAVLLNLILNITFILILPQPLKHAGIATATVLAAFFSAVALAVILQKRIGSPDWRAIRKSALRAFSAAALMAWVVLQVYALFPASGKIGQIISVLCSMTAGGSIYWLGSRLLRAAETDELLDALRRR